MATKVDSWNPGASARAEVHRRDVLSNSRILDAPRMMSGSNVALDVQRLSMVNRWKCRWTYYPRWLAVSAQIKPCILVKTCQML